MIDPIEAAIDAHNVASGRPKPEPILSPLARYNASRARKSGTPLLPLTAEQYAHRERLLGEYRDAPPERAREIRAELRRMDAPDVVPRSGACATMPGRRSL